jgi:hypothetical protein
LQTYFPHPAGYAIHWMMLTVLQHQYGTQFSDHPADPDVVSVPF